MKRFSEDQAKILEAVKGLPPKNVIYLSTEEQKNYWTEVREKFDVIHDFFEAYFTGKPIPSEMLEGELGEFYLAKVEYFLSFYNLIQWGWKYITEESKGSWFDTPGDCFIAFLEKQSQAQLHICQIGRYDIRPRHKNKMRRLAEKIEEGKATRIEITNFQKYIKYLENLGFKEFAKLEIFCVVACEKYAKSIPNLRTKLKDYYAKFEKVEDISKRRDRNRRSYAWENGRILEPGFLTSSKKSNCMA